MLLFTVRLFTCVCLIQLREPVFDRMGERTAYFWIRFLKFFVLLKIYADCP